MANHTRNSAVPDRPCCLLTAPMNSSLKQPQDCVSPELRFEARTMIIVPHVHSHSHRCAPRGLFSTRRIMDNLPNLVPGDHERAIVILPTSQVVMATENTHGRSSNWRARPDSNRYPLPGQGRTLLSYATDPKLECRSFPAATAIPLRTGLCGSLPFTSESPGRLSRADWEFNWLRGLDSNEHHSGYEPAAGTIPAHRAKSFYRDLLLAQTVSRPLAWNCAGCSTVCGAHQVLIFIRRQAINPVLGVIRHRD